MYAKMHNITVGDVIEKGVLLLIENIQPKQGIENTKKFQDALAYVKTLKAKGGSPVPDNENSISSLAEKKYIDCIVTRNKKDFSESSLPVLTVSEFLKEI